MHSFWIIKQMGIIFLCLSLFSIFKPNHSNSRVVTIADGQLGNAKASVFKVYVWHSERPTVPLEGTAFVIHTTGSQDNPTLYFLTAAHVILGDSSDDNTKLDIVEKIQVRFGGGKSDLWEIDKKTIRIPQQWESTGRDFALFKKVAAGRPCEPLPIAETHPDDGAFNALGYPQSFETVLAINGKILGQPGESTPQEWYVVDASLSPGMSGGPVISSEGVFAIVEGRHQAAQELKLIVPLGLAQSFIRENILIPYTSSVAKAEPTYWETIKNSTDPEDFSSYLVKYPNGRFTNLARERFAETAKLLLQQTKTLYEQKRWSDAEILFKKAVRLGVAPDTAQWHTDFGVTLYSLGKWSEAESEFKRAVDLDPNQPNWLYNLGLTQLQQKKWPDYEATQRRLTELEPTNSGKYAELANALYNQQKWAEAEVAIRRALDLDPPNIGYRELLRKILKAQGK